MKTKIKKIIRLGIDTLKAYLVAIIAIILSMLSLNALFGTVCFSKILFGIPCPACGMTRAFFLLLQGKLTESIQMNPMLLLVLLMGIVYGIMKKVLKKSFLFIKYYVIICLLLLIGVYVYRMYLYFPNREPYTYYYKNLLHFLFLIVRNITN